MLVGHEDILFPTTMVGNYPKCLEYMPAERRTVAMKTEPSAMKGDINGDSW
jgi:hypothetical protein